MKNSIFNPINIVYIGLLVLADFLVLVLSLKLTIFLVESSFLVVFDEFIIKSISEYIWIILIVVLLLYSEKIYTTRFDFWSDTKKILKSLFYGFITVFTIITLSKISVDFSMKFLVVFFLISAFLLPIFRRVLKKILFGFEIFKIRVKLVSNSSQYDILKKEFEENWYFGYRVSKKKYDMVLISSKKFGIEDLQKLIKIYSKKTRHLYVVPYMHHLDFSHTNIIDYFNVRLSAIHIENRLLNGKNIFIKYIFEKLLVIFIFPFALLVHIFMFTFIKLDSKGPVIFKQKRLGFKGIAFSCYKYRTMYVNGDEILKDYLANNPDEVEYYNVYHKYKNDPRVTRIGRFLRATSLDEFPQFFNILKNDMNLIGPRPYMLNEKNKIGVYNEDILLKVKPGITGLWQVSGRNNITFADRIELDKWYIQNWSLWMDFVIFMKTLKVIFLKIGAK